MCNNMNSIYIGWDSTEIDAYDVCCKSMIDNASAPNVIYPLKRQELSMYNRTEDDLVSTEFTYTRFLVPHLMNYKGWALFCDCDFLWLDDVNKIFDLAGDKSVYVVKHDYTPKTSTKMGGKQQTNYPRKNWSSLILWNCEKNKELTPAVVNTADPAFLHRFQWLNDNDIGNISIEWNWLVGYYKEPEDGSPKALHFTDGGPWHENYTNCEYSELWQKYNIS